MKTLKTRLMDDYQAKKIHDPCEVAMTWLGRRRSCQRAWDDCETGDWMLWIAEQYGHHPTRGWVCREILAHAMGHAADAMERVPGAEVHVRRLRESRDVLSVVTAESAESAARSAARAAESAARAAAWAARSARSAEEKRQADAVRDLWPSPPWIGGGQ